MNEKSLPIVLVDLVVAVVTVAGIFFVINIFQVPNCTAVEREPIFSWVVPASVALVAGCILELLIGFREQSMLSKALCSSCALVVVLLLVIYKWKVNAISAMAC